jgi:hypothetical protein
LSSIVNIYIIFLLQVHFKESSLILFPHYATGVIDLVPNLPPVSTTLAKPVAKFGAGVIDTGANLPPVSLIPAAILPLLSLIPVVHLDLRISPRIFEKI